MKTHIKHSKGRWHISVELGVEPEATGGTAAMAARNLISQLEEKQSQIAEAIADLRMVQLNPERVEASVKRKN